jgi:hypothetical protein
MMPLNMTRMDAAAARDDLEARTIIAIGNGFGRLVYLASTRDYNTGEYRHEGLISKFGREGAAAALLACHEEVFYRLVRLGLEEFTRELERYVDSPSAQRNKILTAWTGLEPYRVLIPASCNPLVVQLFVSNCKLALEILKTRKPSEDNVDVAGFHAVASD